MLDRSICTVDPLSDILSLLKPRNVSCGAIDAGPGNIQFPASDGIKCHAVTAGAAWLAVDGTTAPIRLLAGDCLILPHGLPYRLASDLSLPPIDYRLVIAGNMPGEVVTWNGGGEATIISATFATEPHHTPMLVDILPPVAHVRDKASRSAPQLSLRQMMHEFGAARPGGRVIVEHLATMLLAQALRAYAVGAGSGFVGWLYALEDRQIGAAIGAMHELPSRRWTVQTVADRAGMSRTSFALRFKTRVGETPMQYLTKLRMLIASERLLHSNDTVAAMAETLGYSSESAFSNAFKREMGRSPRFLRGSSPTSK